MTNGWLERFARSTVLLERGCRPSTAAVWSIARSCSAGAELSFCTSVPSASRVAAYVGAWGCSSSAPHRPTVGLSLWRYWNVSGTATPPDSSFLSRMMWIRWVLKSWTIGAWNSAANLAYSFGNPNSSDSWLDLWSCRNIVMCFGGKDRRRTNDVSRSREYGACTTFWKTCWRCSSCAPDSGQELEANGWAALGVRRESAMVVTDFSEKWKLRLVNFISSSNVTPGNDLRLNASRSRPPGYAGLSSNARMGISLRRTVKRSS
mmetsp:Transcript_19804/g.75922  ORF Transcript_19804/g.75922 Transcript_19804/m.75922 type:complete len:262 (+) Transcript_19804:64-849(+)